VATRQEIFTTREQIVAAERDLLHTLQFHMDVESPFDAVRVMCRLLAPSRQASVELERAAYTCVNDSYVWHLPQWLPCHRSNDASRAVRIR